MESHIKRAEDTVYSSESEAEGLDRWSLYSGGVKFRGLLSVVLLAAFP
jgi:hypothetical protein